MNEATGSFEPGDVVVNHRLCCGFDLVVGTVDSASGSYVA